MKIHNRYRRAKKFKLDEDGEVVDEFSGHRKAHIRTDWDWWDYRRSRGLSIMANAQKRFFAARVGKPWDNVYSEFVGRMKQEKASVAFVLRDRVDWSVELNAVRREDGELATLGRWGWCGKLSSGELYVDPDTKILCRMPAKAAKRHWPYLRRVRNPSDPELPGLKTVNVGDVTYVRREKEHKRRIAPDVFEYEKQYIWFKLVPYIYTFTRKDYSVRNEDGTYPEKTYTETRNRVYQASKKAISKNNLNKVVDTNE